MAAEPLDVRYQTHGSGPTCRRILGALPHWFGIEASVEDYVETADRLPTVIASREGDDVGFLTIVRHSPYAAEVYAMGVLPDWHRRGIGRRLLRHTERLLVTDRVEYLQVKTLSSRKHDEGYAKTRAFYDDMGFRPLEEFPNLWGRDNPALQMVKALGAEP